jgi:hypothetical protein
MGVGGGIYEKVVVVIALEFRGGRETDFILDCKRLPCKQHRQHPSANLPAHDHLPEYLYRKFLKKM